MIGRRLRRCLIRAATAALRTSRSRDERGAATVWFVGLSVVILLVLGVVVDVGRAVTTKMQAVTVAQQAARRAVDSIDVDALRQGAVVNDGAAGSACEWVASGMAEAQCQAMVSATGEVTVTITARSHTSLLAAVGVSGIEVSARQAARPEVGAKAPEGV